MSSLLLRLAVAGSAACPSSTTADLAATITAAETAFAELDVPSFRAATARLETQLPCLTDPVTRPLSAEVHRVQGLLAFANESSDRARTAFAAARSIEPGYRFPETLVPAGNPLLDDYVALPPGVTRTAVPAPAAGRLLFDGETANARPDGRPVLFQHLDGVGAVAVTAYLWPDDPLPGYALPLPAPPGRTRAGARPGRTVLLVALSSAVVSGGLYTGAWVTNQRYRASPLPPLEREGLRAANNGLVVASGATLAVAVGLGTTAAVLGAGR